MTVGELYGAVAYLGFETRLEDEALRRGFYAALGRALAQVNLLRPRHKRVALMHRHPRNLLGTALPAEQMQELSLPQGTRYFSAAVSGEGEILLTDGTGERRFPFSSLRETVLCGEVSGTASLSFSGERFAVHALGAYAVRPVFGTPIPGRGVVYPMREAEPDFLSFRYPALYFGEGAAETDAYFEEDRLRLSENAPEGVYEVDLHLGMPSYGSEVSDGEEIPIDDDLASLLPELIASLIWLEDSPERAAYYASVYQRGCSRLASREREAPGRVISRNGW